MGQGDLDLVVALLIPDFGLGDSSFAGVLESSSLSPAQCLAGDGRLRVITLVGRSNRPTTRSVRANRLRAVKGKGSARAYVLIQRRNFLRCRRFQAVPNLRSASSARDCSRA